MLIQLALANARTIVESIIRCIYYINITIASTDLSNTSNIALLDATQTLTNKTLTSPTINLLITLESISSLHMSNEQYLT